MIVHDTVRLILCKLPDSLAFIRLIICFIIWRFQKQKKTKKTFVSFFFDWLIDWLIGVLLFVIGCLYTAYQQTLLYIIPHINKVDSFIFYLDDVGMVMVSFVWLITRCWNLTFFFQTDKAIRYSTVSITSDVVRWTLSR